MALKPHYKPGEEAETLAEALFYLSDPMARKQVEEFRIEYEAIHGETDLTKRYTSLWPKEQQAWLVKHDPKRYFDGLPPFAKAYLKAKMQAAAQRGKLDDMPAAYLRLFVAREMQLDCEPNDRGR